MSRFFENIIASAVQVIEPGPGRHRPDFSVTEPAGWTDGTAPDGVADQCLGSDLESTMMSKPAPAIPDEHRARLPLPSEPAHSADSANSGTSPEREVKSQKVATTPAHPGSVEPGPPSTAATSPPRAVPAADREPSARDRPLRDADIRSADRLPLQASAALPGRMVPQSMPLARADSLSREGLPAAARSPANRIPEHVPITDSGATSSPAVPPPGPAATGKSAGGGIVDSTRTAPAPGDSPHPANQVQAVNPPAPSPGSRRQGIPPPSRASSATPGLVIQHLEVRVIQSPPPAPPPPEPAVPRAPATTSGAWATSARFYLGGV